VYAYLAGALGAAAETSGYLPGRELDWSFAGINGVCQEELCVLLSKSAVHSGHPLSPPRAVLPPARLLPYSIAADGDTVPSNLSKIKYNVKTFGAKGDGEADDTAALLVRQVEGSVAERLPALCTAK
jgi:hypothetical protein